VTPDGEVTGRPAGAGVTPLGRGRLRLDFADPLSALPETARRLLLAAKDIIARDGFNALTLNRVSEASGENKAMISYYFGNKAGLVAAVVDSVVHEEYMASQNRMKDVAAEYRVRRLIEEMRKMNAATGEFRVFFELLPHVLRDDALRQRIALLYKWYWSVKLEWLGVADPSGAMEDPDLRGLARLLSAIIDGLAVQAAIDPDVDLADTYRILARLLKDSGFTLPDGSLVGGEPGSSSA
jgi:AcrR family transcriptional regulator